jgi:DNA topoisomerase-1
MAVAVYFLDKLALRAGHEKDEDEADTVGCCTLKVENVECIPPNHIKFDFLGKDSIKYENTVDVEVKVYKAVEQFTRTDARGKRKGPRDMLFDTFDATDLNKELKSLMDGLSVKVFRTYNASITLDKLLFEMEEGGGVGHHGEPYCNRTLEAKKADYDRANKEVAILCNHQRSVPKTHEASMAKVTEKLNAMKEEIKDLEAQHSKALKGKGGNPDALASKLSKKMTQLQKAELAAAVKEDLKTVALGTSKINYMDPRITIAWCKRNEVPIEKVFNKSLLNKFHWCMDVDSTFRF